MQTATATSGNTRSLSRFLVLLLLTLGAMIAIPAGASAQTAMCGSYTIGGTSPNYLTIDDAITDLNRRGVSCAVTFLIRSGTYVPTNVGYRLTPVTGMSATNTVTFKPDASATVTISGTTNNGTGVFDIDGGDYYIIDGSNTTGGTSRNMTIVQGNTSYGASLMIRNDADYNVLKNTIIMSSHGAVALDLVLGGVTIFIVPNQFPAAGANGNDSTLIQNNQIGDVNGLVRSHRGIYSYGGSAAAPNVGTKVIGNDVVNFGNTNTNAMGIFISYFNNGAIVRGNTVRMTSAPVGTTTAYGIYVNESLGNGFNPTVEGNTVYGLRPATSASGTVVGILYACNSNNNSSTAKFINNMISIDMGTTSVTAYWTQILLAPSNVNLLVAHNSFYMGGSAGTFFGYYVSQDGSSTITTKNNIFYSTFSSTTYMLYNYSATSTAGWTSSNNLWEFPTGTSNYMAYFGTTLYSSLAAFQTTGNEANSITGNPRFIDPSTGNLHISTTLPTPVESRGTPLTAVPTDFDAQLRSTTTPDIGADEGNFNGGGILVLAPNGGETYLATTAVPFRFTLNRTISVTLQYSLDNGATYTNLGTFSNLTAGTWQGSFTSPDTVTNRARLRVINALNAIEGDTSDASFSLVRPTIRVVTPNGGERFYEGQSVPIQWTSTDIPADKRVMIEFSSDAGRTWSLVATNLVSLNTGTNTYNWSVPVVRTDSARVRVSITDRTIVNDQTDGYFQILKTMNLISPNGGEQWFVGDKHMIKWAVINTNYLLIEYSTNNGATWNEISYAVPAYMDSLEWVVPNTPTNQALVRITNRERPAQQATSATTFTILRSDLAITSPNGGEKYDLNQPITVNWTSANTTTVRLEYSADNGLSWMVINPAIAASAGTYTFTPPAVPTKGGLVRLVNVERERVFDVSNLPFEIMEAPSITIYTPAPGDRYVRGTKANISFEANRIPRVDIYYRASPTAPYTLVASNVSGVLGTYSWTVPNALTSTGQIKIQQTGGTIFTESGLFSIVDPGNPTLTLITPNGGQTYNSGDPVVVRWSSTDLSLVSVYYSGNGGATWNLIASNIASINGIFNWTAPDSAGSNYRIKIESTNPAISDASDSSFTIARRLVPQVTLLYPNGGERFAIDSTITIRWTATDIPGTVTLTYSVDSGASWRPIDIALASLGQMQWTIPGDTVSDNVLVKITNGGSVEDVSDAVFTIYRPVVAAIRVLSPNLATDVWKENESTAITWSSTGVDNVKIEYSKDGGTTWEKIAEAVPSPDAPLHTYNWTVTHIADDTVRSVVVRISRDAAVNPSDLSDAPFSFFPRPTVSVPRSVETGATVMTLSGNFPNPFSGSTEIRWQQRSAGPVSLYVYDNSGRIVRQADLGLRISGDQQATLQADGLSSGSYHYELVSQGGTVRGVMMIVR